MAPVRGGVESGTPVPADGCPCDHRRTGAAPRSTDGPGGGAPRTPAAAWPWQGWSPSPSGVGAREGRGGTPQSGLSRVRACGAAGGRGINPQAALSRGLAGAGRSYQEGEDRETRDTRIDTLSARRAELMGAL